MSQESLNQSMPSLSVNSQMYVSFEGEVNPVKITGLTYEGNQLECIQCLIFPDTNEEFYGELYVEDYGTWSFVD
jgi:hypothetical protein